MITIVDYGAGNIASVQNMLKKIGVPSVTGNSAASVEKATKLILPGVGAFDSCAEKLQQSGLQQLLHKKITADKTPVLGICVGLQLMMAGSEEGLLPGLSLLKGKAIRFNKDKIPAELKIPHMGWAEVELNKPSRLFEGMYEMPRFYFVHSYYVLPEDDNDVMIYARHGHKFAAGLERDNIMGVQFHPEKSHKYGMKLLENFARNF